MHAIVIVSQMHARAMKRLMLMTAATPFHFLHRFHIMHARSATLPVYRNASMQIVTAMHACKKLYCFAALLW